MGIKNKISDLNNILFEQLERLNDDDLKGDDLQQEINRAASIVTVAQQVISNHNVQVDGIKILMEGGYLQPDDAKLVLGH